MRSAVEVASAVDVVRRVPATLAGNLLANTGEAGPRSNEAAQPDPARSADLLAAPGPDLELAPTSAPVPVGPASAAPPAHSAGRASANRTGSAAPIAPYRITEDALLVLDQRELPGRVRELSCGSAASVAAALQSFAVGGGQVLGEIAVCGLELAARSAADRPPAYLRSLLGWTIGLLRDARPSSAILQAALHYVESELAAVDGHTSTHEIVSVVADAARRFVNETETGCANLAVFGAVALKGGPTPLRILTLGANGPSSGGGIGTVGGIVGAAVAAQRRVHVWVAESRPTLSGARIATAEFERAGISFGLIADATAGLLMASGDVDVVLVGAERVAGDGDVAGIVGTYPLAVLANRHGIPFYVCVLRAAFDPNIRRGSDCPNAELPAYMLATFRGARITSAIGEVRVPWLDITPGDLVTAFITDVGLVS